STARTVACQAQRTECGEDKRGRLRNGGCAVADEVVVDVAWHIARIAVRIAGCRINHGRIAFAQGAAGQGGFKEEKGMGGERNSDVGKSGRSIAGLREYVQKSVAAPAEQVGNWAKRAAPGEAPFTRFRVNARKSGGL